MKKKLEKINYSVLFLITTIIFSIPSTIYLLRNKSIINFNEWFTYFLIKPNNYHESTIGAVIFGIILILLMFFFFKILKNSSSEFKTIKKVILYVLLISVFFCLMLPFTTSDIFYYMGTGWIDCKYDQNPFYTTVQEVRTQNPGDEILQRTGIWEKQVVVYGPLWALICKMLSWFSFGNATLCLYVFKISALCIHLLNTLLIWKITKRKKFAILYGLNPLILFEMITNVHNDIYLIFFILVSLYFLIKKKNILLTIIFMALATCVKYVSILLIPFLVLYYLRKEKLTKKILYCSLYALLFVVIIILVYLIYARDISVFLKAIMQQGKYRESIQAIALEISSITGINILTYVKLFFIIIFILVTLNGLIFMFLYKNIKFRNTISKYNNLITAFLFLIITNLCPWYTSWFIPTIFWLKGKQIKNILYLQFSYELVTIINFALFSESYKIGMYYLPIMAIIVIAFNIIGKNKTCIELKERKGE